MVLTPNDRAKTQNSKDIGAVREPVRYGWLSAIVSTVGAELSLPIVGRHASGRPSLRNLPSRTQALPNWWRPSAAAPSALWRAVAP